MYCRTVLKLCGQTWLSLAKSITAFKTAHITPWSVLDYLTAMHKKISGVKEVQLIVYQNYGCFRNAGLPLNSFSLSIYSDKIKNVRIILIFPCINVTKKNLKQFGGEIFFIIPCNFHLKASAV